MTAAQNKVMDEHYKRLTKDNCTYWANSQMHTGYNVHKYYNRKGTYTSFGKISYGVPSSFQIQCPDHDICLLTTAENFARIDENVEKLQAELNVERKTNATLNEEITKLNATVIKLNADNITMKDSITTLITEFKVSIADTRAETKALDEKMTTLTSLMNELKTQINKVFTFIPKFIRNTSLTFVKMITGIKTNTLDDSVADSLAIEL